MLKQFLFLSLFISIRTVAQLPLDQKDLLSRLTAAETLPANILKTRTAVFYDHRVTTKELEMMQEYFQRSGVDAVVYFESDLLTAGRDISVAMAQYLNAREISNIALAEKKPDAYKLWIFEYNRRANFTEDGQAAWVSENRLLEEILKKLYRNANDGLIRENFLINDIPETGLAINPIPGRRSEFYAIDLKVDPLAVLKFGNEEMDLALEEIMKMYPYKYALVEANLSEAEIRRQGYYYVLRFVRARARVAKDLMGYDMTKSQSAIVSIAYAENEPQLKSIPANTEVYKFYFKHIDSGNTFLGTKWDADPDWKQALVNQLKGFKIELKIN